MQAFTLFACLISLILGASSSALGAEARSFALTLPIVTWEQSTARGEYNLNGKGGLAVELAFIPNQDAYSDKEAAEKNNDSLKVERGGEMAIYYSRYSEGRSMSGWYWGMGLGYRRMEVKWKRTPDETFAVTERMYLDEDNRVTHTLTTAGAAAHGRIGYRHVGSSFPVVVGIYMGARHYQNRFEDLEDDRSMETPERDKNALRRRFMSALEPGIELGMTF